MIIDTVREIIHSNNRIVIVSGSGLSTESGIPNFRGVEESFKAESEFNYSPEDLYSSVFFNTRPELFFQYYKHYILYLDNQPNAAHYAIADLEKQGKLTGIVTRSTYGLHQMAGAKDVIELHGSIHRNVCTKCGTEYSAAYIKESSGIPTCQHCKSIIRPKIGLLGEKIDNSRLSNACKAVDCADILLVVGTNLHSNLTSQFADRFSGGDIILINEKENFTDKRASYVIHDKPSKIMPLVI